MSPTDEVSVLASSVVDALAPLRQGFQADGADLVVETVTGGHVVVRLVVSDETCLECIVPTSMLERVLATRLAQHVPGFEHVELIDPR
jgi:hypothetical protein